MVKTAPLFLFCGFYCPYLSNQVLLTMVPLKHFILLSALFAVSTKAYAELPGSYSVGVSLDNRFMYVFKDMIDDRVSLSERYGGYHGTICGIPPLSADVNYSVYKWLDLSAGITWTCIWGDVYDSYEGKEPKQVTSNSFYIIPSARLNIINTANFGFYLKAGYGLGAHFNRSDAHLAGMDFIESHNDYLLDKGHNCLKGSMEVVEGIRFKNFFYEFGAGARFNGMGHRIGFEFKF